MRSRPLHHALRAACFVLTCCFAFACRAPDARGGDQTGSTEATAIVEQQHSTTESAIRSPSGDPSSTQSLPPLPRIASGQMPIYPPISRRLGEEGSVEVVLDVRQDGEVVSVAIDSSSGSPRLDEAVLHAARTWRFLARTGPRGIDRMRHRIVFELTRE